MFKIVTVTDYIPGVLALICLVGIWAYAFFENTKD